MDKKTENPNRNYPHQLRVRQLHRWHRRATTDKERAMWRKRMEWLEIVYAPEHYREDNDHG